MDRSHKTSSVLLAGTDRYPYGCMDKCYLFSCLFEPVTLSVAVRLEDLCDPQQVLPNSKLYDLPTGDNSAVSVGSFATWIKNYQ